MVLNYGYRQNLLCISLIPCVNHWCLWLWLNPLRPKGDVGRLQFLSTSFCLLLFFLPRSRSCQLFLVRCVVLCARCSLVFPVFEDLGFHSSACFVIFFSFFSQSVSHPPPFSGSYCLWKWLLLCPSPQFLVWDGVWPTDVKDVSQTFINKCLDAIAGSYCFSPGLRSI